MNSKRLISVTLLVFVLFSICFFVWSEFIRDAYGNQNEPALKASESKVIVYYFHGTYRCTTCLTIEQYSHEAVEFYFSKEIQEGKLQFTVLNVDEPPNKHFIKDYKLYAQSLVVVLYKDGKQVKWKNLEEIWNLVDYRYKFYEYVKNEVEEVLKEAT
jgi:thiol-disulfide isomerase/thioredoxin